MKYIRAMMKSKTRRVLCTQHYGRKFLRWCVSIFHWNMTIVSMQLSNDDVTVLVT